MTLTLSTPALVRLLETEVPEGASATISLNVPLRLTRTGKVVRLIQGDGRASAPTTVEESLVKLIVRARGWWDRLWTGEIHVAALAREEGVSASYIGKFVMLAFLSPALLETILSGDQPAHVTAITLTAGKLPIRWKEQERLFG